MKKVPVDPKVIEEARQRVKAAFPYNGLRIGFFTDDAPGASIFGGIAKVAKTVLMSIVGDSVDLRFYRQPKPEERRPDLTYKVYEYKDANTENTKFQRGPNVADHHIQHDVHEDMMRQNNMTIKVVPDGSGGLKPDIQPDGTALAYINFSNPTPEMYRVLSAEAVEAQRIAMEAENSPKDPPPAAV